MNLPKVSIIITSYNRAHFIETAIKSAMDQDYSNLEIVISDNCSTDNSDDVIKKYLYDKRIKYFRNESNIGMVRNFSKATKILSTGEYVTYVSSDDYLMNPKFVSQSMDIMLEDKSIIMVAANYVGLKDNNTFGDIVDDDLFNVRIREGIEVFWNFVKGKSPLSFAGCILNRGLLNKLDVFENNYIYGDLYCNLKVILEGKVGFVKNRSYVFREHDGNESSINSISDIKNVFTMIDDIAEYAGSKLGPEFKNKLDGWRSEYIRNQIVINARVLYKTNRKEFKEFMQFLRLKYSKEYYKCFINLKWIGFVVKLRLMPD